MRNISFYSVIPNIKWASPTSFNKYIDWDLISLSNNLVWLDGGYRFNVPVLND